MFPGVEWIDRMATDAANTITLESGETYSSAFAALLYGAPREMPCRNFNAWVNSILFGNGVTSSFIHKFGIEWTHYILCYLRNFLGAMLVYYGTGGVFHYYCYVHPMSKDIFKERTRPSSATIRNQISLSQKSMFVYVFLPVVDEFLVEAGWTKTYFTIDEIGGWPQYLASMIFYFACVEIGIYWMHRTLHTNKWMYKYIHMKHHQYKKAETLTPWASIAFNPVDGMLQACPYVLCQFFAPCHYLTHFGLLFFTAIWATYIHDSMDWNVDPIMGSKYHTVHHTHYIYNYGQVFTFCDRLWGTFREPEGPTGIPTKRKGQ
jgi:lathosterol oxidase